MTKAQKLRMAARGSYAIAGVIVLGFFLVLVQVKSTPDHFNWYPMPEAIVLTVLFAAAVGVGFTCEVWAHREQARPAERAAAETKARVASQIRKARMVGPGIYMHGRMTAHLNVRTKALKVEWSESGAEAGKLVPSKSGFDAYDADGNPLGWVNDKTEGMTVIERSAP